MNLSANDRGHLCFNRRPFYGFHFRVPNLISKRFMPHCMPSNMLFGCPQSCFTGQVDEVVHSQVRLPIVETGAVSCYGIAVTLTGSRCCCSYRRRALLMRTTG